MKSSTPKGWSVVWRADRRQYVLKYTGSDGKPAQHYVPRENGAKRLAEAYAEQWMIDLPAGVATKRRAAGGRTVGECVTLFNKLRKLDERKAIATIEANAEQLKTHVLPHFKDRPLSKLAVDFPALLTWIRAIRLELSPSRTRNIFSTFRLLFDYAQPNGWSAIAANPLRNKAMVDELPDLPKAAARGVATVPMFDVQCLVHGARACSAIGERVPLDRRVLTLLGATTGARDGELRARRWKDVDIDRKPLKAEDGVVGVEVPIMRIDDALQLRGRLGHATHGPTKTTGSRRIVPLHDAVVDALLEWRDSNQGVNILLGHKPRPDDPIFPAPGGGFCRPRGAEQLRADLEALALPVASTKGRPIQFKALRATFATTLERAGVRDQVRKRLLGHVSGDVTWEHYTDEDRTALLAAVHSMPLHWVSARLTDTLRGRKDTKRKPLSTSVPLLNPTIESATMGQGESMTPPETKGQGFRKPQVSSSSLEGGSTQVSGSAPKFEGSRDTRVSVTPSKDTASDTSRGIRSRGGSSGTQTVVKGATQRENFPRVALAAEGAQRVKPRGVRRAILRAIDLAKIGDEPATHEAMRLAVRQMGLGGRRSR